MPTPENLVKALRHANGQSEMAVGARIILGMVDAAYSRFETGETGLDWSHIRTCAERTIVAFGDDRTGVAEAGFERDFSFARIALRVAEAVEAGFGPDAIAEMFTDEAIGFDESDIEAEREWERRNS